jgi:hypothetical protein
MVQVNHAAPISIAAAASVSSATDTTPPIAAIAEPTTAIAAAT